MRYVVKRKRILTHWFKATEEWWELWGESNSLYIAGDLMMECPFWYGEEVVIFDMEDERYPERVAVKTRKKEKKSAV